MKKIMILWTLTTTKYAVDILKVTSQIYKCIHFSRKECLSVCCENDMLRLVIFMNLKHLILNSQVFWLLTKKKGFLFAYLVLSLQVLVPLKEFWARKVDRYQIFFSDFVHQRYLDVDDETCLFSAKYLYRVRMYKIK